MVPQTLMVPRANAIRALPDAVAPSKQMLAAYWRKVAPRALLHLGRRPLTLVRQVRGKIFFHRGPLPPIPAAVHSLKMERREGGEGIRLWIDSLEGLLGLVDIGVVEIHPWGATVDDIERPDLLVLDLHPGDGVGWEFVIETALAMRELLQREGLASWPKTTGGEDLHVMVPVEPSLEWDAARSCCRRLAERLAATAPRRYTTSPGSANRTNRLFIDYLRNGRGSTAVGAYSPIARSGFPIAAPVTWDELESGIRSDAHTMARPASIRGSEPSIGG